MKKATELFSDQEIASIEVAIGEAESMTSAEIVPVVVSVSGRYDRAEDLFGFLLSLVVLACAWSPIQTFASSMSIWNESSMAGAQLPMVLSLLVVTFLVGTALATHFPVLRLPLISKREMQEEVELRARESFQRLKIRKTEGATGILIYVSVYERMVHVVGDGAINKNLSEADWRQLCDTIIVGLKNSKSEDGLINGILQCGTLLEQHCPREPDDKNELANKLHLID